MVSVRTIAARRKTKTAYPNCRARVHAAIEAAGACLTGRELARLTGLTYRQTVDALTALHRQGRIDRHGRKFTASWCPLTPQHDPSADLQAALYRIAAAKHDRR